MEAIHMSVKITSIFMILTAQPPSSLPSSSPINLPDLILSYLILSDCVRD
jgi:hypothetical protein